MRAGGRIGLGLAGLLVVLIVAVGAGTVLGVGPLAPSPDPREITDPDEILARSLQAVLDADAVHLAGTVSGTLPPGVAGPGAGITSLQGTSITIDVRPDDGKTRTHVESPGLGLVLDSVTVWDSIYWRTDEAAPWTRASLGDASADAGLDINPLTLVDRLRAYLATPGPTPTLATVVCAGASGRCREVRLEAGSDPAIILGMLLPADLAAALADVDTVVTLQSDVDTLRPVRLVAEATSPDGSVRLRLVVEAGRWDEDLVIDEPPADEVAED